MLKWSIILTAALNLMACTQNSKANKQIYGQIEVDEVDVASRVPARVAKVLVKPGQKVKAGDLLIEFEDDVVSAKRGQAKAVMAAAESRSQIAKDAVRPEEKEQLAAAVSAARKQLDLAKVSFERAQGAFAEGAISRQNLDEVQFKFQAANEQYKAAEAKMRMANQGARKEDRQGADALLEQAKNAVAEAEAYSKDMALRSPIDGEIYQILNHEGELVPAGYPVVTILKMADLWSTFNVIETRLADFPMGKKVQIKIPALNDRVAAAQISSISAMAGFATKTSTQDRGQFDLKTFEIRATLVEPIPELRPGMTVIVQSAAD